ncbi:hypothetical protein TruAng_011465 [Truncatella angustata]|nr:hypothetical protein TruAng_011465 [Truncatella angustata]
MYSSIVLIMTLALAGITIATPTWVSGRAPLGQMVKRNEWCNGTYDSAPYWGICTNNCQFKPAISGCVLQDWDCINECYCHCSIKFCHGGKPANNGTGGIWK